MLLRSYYSDYGNAHLRQAELKIWALKTEGGTVPKKTVGGLLESARGPKNNGGTWCTSDIRFFLCVFFLFLFFLFFSPPGMGVSIPSPRLLVSRQVRRLRQDRAGKAGGLPV